MLTRRFLLLVAMGFPAVSIGQNPLWSLHGGGTFDEAGGAVCGVGDLDGDGFADFLVGAPQSAVPGARGYVRVYSGKDARLIRTLHGKASGDGFGISVSGAGDVNKDGVPDFLVGATPVTASSKPGYAQVFSGRDASVLWEVQGDSAGEWFGVSVSGGGDLDLDGYADFLVGAPFDDHKIQNGGVVRAYSGKTGKVLHELKGPAAEDCYGFAVTGGGDIDNDGRPDIVVGAYNNDKASVNAGAVFVYSGKDGRQFLQLTGESISDGFGFSVATAGDVNKDGHADFLVGSLWDDKTATDVGSVWLFSGKTGDVLKRIGGDQAYDGMGTAVAGAGDVDGDGWLDIAGGAIQGFPPGRSGYVRVWSGRDFTEIYTQRGQRAGDWFGRSLAAAGDVNQDGFADLLVGASHATVSLARQGSGWVFAGSHVGLEVNRAELSLASGGVQIMRLDARRVHGGKRYLVLGTAGATRPGIPLGPITSPLTNDEYFLLTLISPNSLLLRLTFGILDANGKATAFFILPPGLPPSLAGLTLHHSFVVFGQSGAGLEFASSPASVKLVR